jgi:hypothetical protein
MGDYDSDDERPTVWDRIAKSPGSYPKDFVQDVSKYPLMVPNTWTEDSPFGKITCEIVRDKAFGHLCGYITLPKTLDVDALCPHGGVTYHSGMKIGFDCSHSGDFSLLFKQGAYRDYDFVKREILTMIGNLKEIGS